MTSKAEAQAALAAARKAEADAARVPAGYRKADDAWENFHAVHSAHIKSQPSPRAPRG